MLACGDDDDEVAVVVGVLDVCDAGSVELEDIVAGDVLEVVDAWLEGLAASAFAVCDAVAEVVSFTARR